MALIARLYSDRGAAESAAAELKSKGADFGNTEIISGPGAPETAEPPATEPILERVKQAGVAPGHAEIYAERIAHGAALLVTTPLFMHGVTATEILDDHHPVSLDLPYLGRQYSTAEQRAAPLSVKMGWPVLCNDPAPLSRKLGWPTLKAEQASLTSSESISSRSQDAAPLSRVTGLPALSDNPAPLSGLLKWATLRDDAAPLSDRIKWRTLLSEPAPLSKRLSWRTLANDPAPLSRLLGLPVLSKRQ